MTRKSKELFGWIVAGLAVGVGLGWGPYAKSIEQDAESRRLLADVKRAEVNKENLIQKVGVLQSVQGQEEQARQHGWRKPDETVLR